jgi:hypothetical protein
MNNELSYWAGELVGKLEFLWVIRLVQEKLLTNRLSVRPLKIMVSG